MPVSVAKNIILNLVSQCEKNDNFRFFAIKTDYSAKFF